MAFLDTLGRVLRRDPGVRADRDVDRRRLRDSWGLDDGGTGSPEFPGEAPATDPAAMAAPPATVEHCQREEFALMVRRAVADRDITLQEHHKLDLARTLIGLSEDEAEATLHAIAAEAEAFFGKPVEGT